MREADIPFPHTAPLLSPTYSGSTSRLSPLLPLASAGPIASSLFPAVLANQHEVIQSSGSFFIADFHGTKGLTSTNLLVDGFVARTFTAGDANSYLMLLLWTPQGQSFLEYYGIEYHRGAWYIRHNSNLVQGTSPGVPYLPTPLLDYSMKETTGTVVTQRRWTPAEEVDIRRHVQCAALLLPIFFVNRNGSLGFWLTDILRGCDRELHNANSFAPLGGEYTTQVRIHVSRSLDC